MIFGIIAIFTLVFLLNLNVYNIVLAAMLGIFQIPFAIYEKVNKKIVLMFITIVGMLIHFYKFVFFERYLAAALLIVIPGMVFEELIKEKTNTMKIIFKTSGIMFACLLVFIVISNRLFQTDYFALINSGIDFVYEINVEMMKEAKIEQSTNILKEATGVIKYYVPAILYLLSAITAIIMTLMYGMVSVVLKLKNKVTVTNIYDYRFSKLIPLAYLILNMVVNSINERANYNVYRFFENFSVILIFIIIFAGLIMLLDKVSMMKINTVFKNVIAMIVILMFWILPQVYMVLGFLDILFNVRKKTKA